MAADVEGDEPMDQRIGERRGGGAGAAMRRVGKAGRGRGGGGGGARAERKSARREHGRMAGVGEWK